MKVYQAIASKLQARVNCINSNNTEWENKHTESLLEIQENYLPSGSGIDSGCEIIIDCYKPEREFRINTSFHHMEEGMYTRWTDHTIEVKPDFINGIRLSISGKNYNDIEDYLYELFYDALTQDYNE